MRASRVCAIGVAALTGCSLFVTLGDLQNGSPGDAGADGSDAIADATPLQEGSVDGSTSAYAITVLSDSPIAYYRLGDPGTTAIDETANHLDGTYSVAVSAAAGLLSGDPNGAALFSGSSDAGAQIGISVPDTPLFNPKAALSIEAWARPLQIRRAELVSYGAQTSAPYQSWALQIDVGSSTAPPGSFTNFFYTSNAGHVYGTEVIAAGNVYHLVATFDGVTLSTYTNGVLDNTAGASGLLSYDDAGLGLSMGSGTLGEVPFLGVLDEVAVYDHALTAARVAAHYQAGTK